MEKWTLDRQHALRYRLRLNTGKRGWWCMFDYVAIPDPAVAEIEVVIGPTPDLDTLKWFPDLKRGMDRGRLSLQERLARTLVGIRVEIVKIHAHPVDTEAWGCERHGWEFIFDLGKDWAVKAAEE